MDASWLSVDVRSKFNGCLMVLLECWMEISWMLNGLSGCWMDISWILNGFSGCWMDI